MKKKLLAILLTLAMVVTMIPAVFVTVTAEEDLTDYVAISDAATLYEKLAGCTDSATTYKFKLTADFDVTAENWVGIMDKYNVTIDGQGHTITVDIDDLPDSVMGQARWPKFGVFASRAVGVWYIRNVNIVGEFTKTENTTTDQGPEIGSVVGCARGEVNLENVHSSLNITVNDQHAAPMLGGLVGQADSHDYSSAYFTDCSYTGSITTNMDTKTTGAFLGSYNGAAKGYGFLDCSSDGATLNDVAFTDQVGPTGGWMALPSATAISDYAGLKGMTGGNYYLTADIAVTAQDIATHGAWEPVKNTKIILEGNNHRISNLNYEQTDDTISTTWAKPALLLKNAQTGTVFSRLTVEGSLSTSKAQAGMQMGGLVGCACAKVSFVDVVNKVTVTDEYSTGGAVGGFVGSGNGMTQITFMGCVNEGNVTGSKTSGRVGGFIGAGGFASANASIPDYYIRFIDCVNKGTVKGATGDTGGIFGGDNPGVAKGVDISFINCVNNGNVSATGAAVGGICCYLNNFINYTADGCVNNGVVESAASGAGLFRDMQNATSVTIRNCVNNGEYSGKATYGAGVIGHVSGDNITIDGCVNNANVDIAFTRDYWGFGGVVGYLKCNTTALKISNCVNYGDVTVTGATASTLVGGVIAYIQTSGSGATVFDCANYGTVSADKGYVAGVMGGVENNTTTTVTGCYNFGTVQNTGTTDSEQGVAGIVNRLNGNVTLTVDKCHNFGKLSTNVNGWTKAAGIVATSLAIKSANDLNGNGKLDDPENVVKVTITNCSNFGEFEVYDYSGRWNNVYSPEFAGIMAAATNQIAAGSVYKISNCYSHGPIVKETAKAAATAAAKAPIDYTDGEGNPAQYEFSLTKTGVKAIGGSAAAETKAVNNCVANYQLLDADWTANTFSGVSGTGNIDMIASTMMNDVTSTLGNAFVLDGEQLEPVYALNTPATQVFATQEANKTNSTVDVRVLALVNSLNYDLAGVRIYNADKSSSAEKTTTTVYSGVVDTTKGTVDAPYGTYYLPITVKGVGTTGTYTFIVETFVEKGGVETAGATYTVVVDNGEVSAKKN